jgi:hypothetical protein
MPQMKVSQLIAQLQKHLEVHGDLPVAFLNEYKYDDVKDITVEVTSTECGYRYGASDGCESPELYIILS